MAVCRAYPSNLVRDETPTHRFALPPLGEPTTANVHGVEQRGGRSQPRLKAGLHWFIRHLFDETCWQFGYSPRLLVEEDSDSARVDDDEGVLPVPVGRQDLHGVGDDGLNVLLRELPGDQAVDLDGEGVRQQ